MEATTTIAKVRANQQTLRDNVTKRIIAYVLKTIDHASSNSLKKSVQFTCYRGDYLYAPGIDSPEYGVPLRDMDDDVALSVVEEKLPEGFATHREVNIVRVSW